MKLKKFISGLLLFIIMISTYAEDTVCRQGICLTVMTESELSAENAKRAQGAFKNLQDLANWLASWIITPTNEETFVPLSSLEDLLNTNSLKILVGTKEIDLLPVDCGSCDRAVVLTQNPCVIRVISTTYQLIFDITVAIKDNKLAITNIQKVSQEDYQKQLLGQKNQNLAKEESKIKTAEKSKQTLHEEQYAFLEKNIPVYVSMETHDLPGYHFEWRFVGKPTAKVGIVPNVGGHKFIGYMNENDVLEGESLQLTINQTNAGPVFASFIPGPKKLEGIELNGKKFNVVLETSMTDVRATGESKAIKILKVKMLRPSGIETQEEHIRRILKKTG